MFYTLFFIVPFVFITLAIAMPIGIRHNIPSWLNVNIGRLNADDIRRLNENQLKYLCKRAFVNLSLAAILTVLIGIAFIMNGYADNPMTSLICCAIQFIAGMALSYPLFKRAKSIKSEIDELIQ